MESCCESRPIWALLLFVQPSLRPPVLKRELHVRFICYVDYLEIPVPVVGHCANWTKREFVMIMQVTVSRVPGRRWGIDLV